MFDVMERKKKETGQERRASCYVAPSDVEPVLRVTPAPHTTISTKLSSIMPVPVNVHAYRFR